MRMFSRLITAAFAASLLLPAAMVAPVMGVVIVETLNFSGVPATAVAGADTVITVEADISGLVDLAYTGTVTLDTGDVSDVVTPVSHHYSGGDAGTFDFHVTFGTAGPRTLTASDGSSTDATGGLTVVPGAADVTTSTITAFPTSITTADFSTITVQLKDAEGNDVTSSGGTVTLAADNSGITQTVVDHANGTYTANFLSSQLGLSNISGKLNGVDLTDTATVTVTLGVADHVTILTQPGNGTGGTALSTQPFVQVRDNGGNVVPGVRNITFAIGTNPSGGVLSGTTTVATDASGNATFTDLSIDKVGTGYTLVASSAGLGSDTSSAFNVTVGPAAKLAFGQGPTGSPQGVAIAPAMTVQVQDLGGNLVTTNTSSVHLAIGTNPSGGTLSGTATVAAVAGVATFSTISINLAGVGYTLTATDGSLTLVTSAPFTITLAANHAPAGADKTIPTFKNMVYTFTTSDFGFSDASDVPPNTLLAVKITTLPAAGTLKDNGATFVAGTSIAVADITGGKLTFTPAANATGSPYAHFTFQVRDNGGTAGGGVDLDQTPNTITLNVVADTFKPTTTAPVPSLAAQTIGSTSVVVRLTWTGADVGSGIASYQFQESKNGGAYVTVSLSSALSLSTSRTLHVGDTYRARVRAVDKVGNVGAWTYSGLRFTVLRFQQTSATYTGTWVTRTSTAYSGGTERTTSANGSAATFTTTGRTFTWVGVKGSDRGTAQVFVDGVLSTTVNLTQTTRKYQYVVFSTSFASSASHTIRIVFTATAPKLIDVDAFIVLR